jgi:hypothetical protein
LLAHHNAGLLGVLMNPHSEPTPLPFIVFSDSVLREQGTGKVSLIGTFEFFNAPSFPFQTPQFFATVGITNVQLFRGEGGPSEININLRVEHPRSGHVFGNATGKVGVMEGKTVEREAVLIVPIPLPPMTFPEPGPINVILSIDNERVAERRLRILPASAATIT